MKFLKYTLSKSLYWIIIGLLTSGGSIVIFIKSLDIRDLVMVVFFTAILAVVVGYDYWRYKNKK